MNGVSGEQELRRQLEDYELPSRFLLPQQQQQHPATTRLDSHRRREYTHARDVYLQRKFQRALVQQVLTTFDGVEKFDRTVSTGDGSAAHEQQQEGLIWCEGLCNCILISGF